ncbi:hypothetical protein TRVA0_057S00650 [Trichomonascus vanleenenianus]|uniref:uncharacterized protein n=1 Tax=Trichomonascus vanleenenianus TaxID=2268995 RepID=UPI003EC9E88F
MGESRKHLVAIIVTTAVISSAISVVGTLLVQRYMREWKGEYEVPKEKRINFNRPDLIEKYEPCTSSGDEKKKKKRKRNREKTPKNDWLYDY